MNGAKWVDSPLGLPMVLVSYFDTPIDLKSSWRSKNLTRNELEARAKARACQGVWWKADHIARLRLTTGIIKGGIKVFEKQQTKHPVSLKVWLSKGPWPRNDLGNPWDTADLAGGFNFFPGDSSTELKTASVAQAAQNFKEAYGLVTWRPRCDG